MRTKVLKYLLEKEFKQMMRNPVMLPLIIALPLIQLVILPYAATYEIRNIRIAVVDNDHSATSRALEEKIASSGYFRIVRQASNHQEAQQCIREGVAGMSIEIPLGFETDLKLNRPTGVYINVDAVDGMKAGIVSSYMGKVIQDFATQTAHSVPASIEVRPQFRFNPDLDYKTYMVPGILAMLLTLVGGILAALNISGERESGTLEQINVSPVSKTDYLLGKLIPFWIMGIIITLVGLGIAYILYGLIPKGNLFTLLVFAIIYNMGFIGFGLFISSVAKSQQQAMFIAFFFLLIFFLMGGLFTPVSSMPRWAQYITYLNPTAYLIDAMRLIILKGSHFSDLYPQFWATVSFAVAFNVMASLAFHKTAR